MPEETIITAARDGVFTVTLDRPAKLNALTPAMHLALGEAFDAFAADDALQVCIVTGAGDRAFCAGSDLAGFSAREGGTYPPSGYAGLAGRSGLDKPVIAAVNGLCLGGGLELALACDIVVAADTAVFGLPEPRVGLIAIGGGIHRLVRDIGLKRAMVPLLTGRDIPAAEAWRLGLVSELVPAGELPARVETLAREIIACAPLAVRATKALAYWGLEQPSAVTALAGQGAQPAFREWSGSEDAVEGPAAFTGKRKPEWQGR